MADARALVDAELSGGAHVVLCGTHDIMRRRLCKSAQTVEAVRAALTERRSGTRRGVRGEVDELAERLNAAFTNDRRATDRRAS